MTFHHHDHFNIWLFHYFVLHFILYEKLNPLSRCVSFYRRLSHHQRNRTTEEMESFKMPSYISTPNSFLSWQLATIATSIWTVSSACLVHKKHFVVSEKERNTVLYAQETLCCLGKRNTVFYTQAKERNTVLYLSCWDNKVFLMHRKQYFFHFFLLPRQRSVSCT